VLAATADTGVGSDQSIGLLLDRTHLADAHLDNPVKGFTKGFGFNSGTGDRDRSLNHVQDGRRVWRLADYQMIRDDDRHLDFVCGRAIHWSFSWASVISARQTWQRV